MSEPEKKTSLFGVILLYLISLFNVYLYTGLSFVLMQIFGFPYEAFSERQLFQDALVMALPLAPVIVYILRRLRIEEKSPAESRLAMYKFLGVLLPCLALYCFLFLYININFSPSGAQLCSGEIVKKRRVQMKNGISHRLVVTCDVGDGKSFQVEKRISEADYHNLTVGELQPLTYLRGRLGVDLLIRPRAE